MLKLIPIHGDQVAELCNHCLLFSTMWDFHYLDHCLSPRVETVLESSSQLLLILKCPSDGSGRTRFTCILFFSSHPDLRTSTILLSKVKFEFLRLWRAKEVIPYHLMARILLSLTVRIHTVASYLAILLPAFYIFKRLLSTDSYS